MDNMLNETEPHQSFQSPPRRRRSTFFERRDSIAPQPITENNESNISDRRENNEKFCRDLQRYFNQLLNEKELWKKEVKERRNLYHDLREQYILATKAPTRSRLSYSALSNEDIEFLKDKPNISKLVESQQKLHKAVKETKALYRRLNELDDVILTFSESKVKTITEYILENSSVEP